MLAAAAEGGNGVALAVAVKRYPAALASHEQVVNQPGLFWDTLKSLHSMLGTKFSVPVIAKKELDLHKLYVEVTSRGGYEKVVHDKKWREIGYAFNFAPTTTSASFVLRKHYNTLLFHFEQVYFFNSQVPALSPPSALFPLEQHFCRPDVANNGEHMPETRVGEERGGDLSNPADGERVGSTVVGMINGKFDGGYLVSVRMGSQVLNGVLYHPVKHPVAASFRDPDYHPMQQPVAASSPDPDEDTDPEPINAIVPYDPNPHPPGRGRRRKKRRRWGGDPTHPKPNRSGYNFFFAEKHAMLKSLYPNKREFTKMVGNSWNNLGPEERLVYQKIGMEDKERYKRELNEYRKLKQQTHEALNGSGTAAY